MTKFYFLITKLIHMDVKTLREILSSFKDDDKVVLSTCDHNGDEIDLFGFYVDAIYNCQDNNDKDFTEVRICQLPHNTN